MDRELLEFLSLEIPSIPEVEDGFLEIINQQHREILNSRIYAYYLNANNHDKVASKFKKALLDLIKLKTQKKLELENHVCFTEVSTKNGRIDIVIEDSIEKEVIIIENKLFHHLNNDLLDYWNHYEYPESNKVGVLLTIEKHEIPKSVKTKFINITHLEWTKKIQELGLPSGLLHKHYIYLNDFFQTIQNLTKSYEMNDQALFYFQNCKKILKAQETVGEGQRFMSNQFEVLASKLNLSVHGSSMNWKNLWDKAEDKHTYYTVIFEEIMKGGNTIQIIIELYERDMPHESDLREELKENVHYKKMDLSDHRTSYYLHFASLTYELVLDDIENFANFVYNKIEEDFKPVMKVIMNKLYPKK